MSDFRHVHTDAYGVHWEMRTEADKSITLRATDPNMQLLLDRNKAEYNESGKSKKTGAARWQKVADIPPLVEIEWRDKYGVDLHNPDHRPAVMRLLNSSDYLYLRTGGGHLSAK